MSIRNAVNRTLLLGAIASLPLIAGGCWYSQGGTGFSKDEHVYVSTAWRPWTVTLVDTRTGEAVWSADVPVDQQLVVRFRKGDGPSDELPDMMDWGLMDAGEWYGNRDNRLPVPGRDARLLKPTLRPTPEMPGTILTTAPEPTDEIIETTPYEAPMDDMGSDDEAPIDLPDGE